MNKKGKFAVIVSMILLTMTMLPITAYAEVPNQNVNVNFCTLSEGGQYLCTIDILDASQNYIGDGGEHEVYWYDDIGGVTLEVDALTIQRGNSIVITLYPLSDDHIPLSEFVSVDGLYTMYGSLMVAGSQNTYMNLLTAWVSFADGTEVQIANGYQYDATYPLASIDYIEFRYYFFNLQITELTADILQIENTTILQNMRPTFDWNTGTFDYTDVPYQPYDSNWFSSGGGFTQADIDRAYQEGFDNGFETGSDSTNTDEVVNANWTSFVFNALNGVLGFEILPGLPLWGMLSAVVAIPLLIMFLKMFMGG